MSSPSQHQGYRDSLENGRLWTNFLVNATDTPCARNAPVDAAVYAVDGDAMVSACVMRTASNTFTEYRRHIATAVAGHMRAAPIGADVHVLFSHPTLVSTAALPPVSRSVVSCAVDWLEEDDMSCTRLFDNPDARWPAGDTHPDIVLGLLPFVLQLRAAATSAILAYMTSREHFHRNYRITNAVDQYTARVARVKDKLGTGHTATDCTVGVAKVAFATVSRGMHGTCAPESCLTSLAQLATMARPTGKDCDTTRCRILVSEDALWLPTLLVNVAANPSTVGRVVVSVLGTVDSLSCDTSDLLYCNATDLHLRLARTLASELTRGKEGSDVGGVVRTLLFVILHHMLMVTRDAVSPRDPASIWQAFLAFHPRSRASLAHRCPVTPRSVVIAVGPSEAVECTLEGAVTVDRLSAHISVARAAIVQFMAWLEQAPVSRHMGGKVAMLRSESLCRAMDGQAANTPPWNLLAECARVTRSAWYMTAYHLLGAVGSFVGPAASHWKSDVAPAGWRPHELELDDTGRSLLIAHARGSPPYVLRPLGSGDKDMAAVIDSSVRVRLFQL